MLDKIIQVIDILDKITIVFAFIIMILTIYNWVQYRKMQQKIKIILLINNEQKPLPLTILRRHFTRAEILGVLGVFDKDSQFTIHHTATEKFFNDIQAVQLGKQDEIIIPIRNNDKFDYYLTPKK